MSVGTQDHFACERCGKSYRIKPGYAGRNVKCGCGHVMTVPTSAPPDDDLYDVVEPTTSPLPAVTKPLQKIEYKRPDIVVPSTFTRWFPDPVKDLYMPVVLISIGAIVEMIFYVYVLNPFGRYGLFRDHFLKVLAVDVLFTTAIMSGVALLAAKVRAISFGPLPVAAMKMCAVVLGGNGAAILLAPLFMFIPYLGVLAMWALPLATYYTILGALFDLDESDTTFCVSVLFVTWVGVMVLFRFLL